MGKGLCKVSQLKVRVHPQSSSESREGFHQEKFSHAVVPTTDRTVGDAGQQTWAGEQKNVNPAGLALLSSGAALGWCRGLGF